MHFLRRYDWPFHLATIALCSFFMAQAIMTYVAGVLQRGIEGDVEERKVLTTPSTPPSSSEIDEEPSGPEAYSIVSERNIFNSMDTGLQSEENPEGQVQPAEGVNPSGPAVKTSLEIKLLGTLVIGEGTDRRSSAIVSGGKGSGKGGADVYFPGDEQKAFAPNARLLKVAKDRIEFLNGGRLEFAEIEDFAAKKSIFATVDEAHGGKGSLVKEGETALAPPPMAGDENRIVIDQREIDDALQNLDKLMTEIRIVPNFKEGQAAGMKVLSVKPGSVISKLGIKRGDILEKVNGQDLDVRQGMELFNQMRDMRSFALDITRGGKNQTLQYEIR